MRGLPTILHEHANLTDTPWFQKIADRLLAPCTDIAIAVSKSTADFVIHARQMPPERVKVVYLGVPLEEFSRAATPEEIAAARAELGIAPGEFAIGTVTRLHDSKGNSYLVDAARLVLRRAAARRASSSSAKARCARRSRRRRGARPRRSIRVRRVRAGRRARRLGVRRQRVSVAVGRDAADGVRGAGDGEADRRDRRRRPARRARRTTATR